MLYVKLNKALYGMLRSALLFYNKLVSELKEIGFVLNPYDPCVANREINGSQQTVTWHVDNLKVSHIDPAVNTQLVKTLSNHLRTGYHCLKRAGTRLSGYVLSDSEIALRSVAQIKRNRIMDTNGSISKSRLDRLGGVITRGRLGKNS